MWVCVCVCACACVRVCVCVCVCVCVWLAVCVCVVCVHPKYVFLLPNVGYPSAYSLRILVYTQYIHIHTHTQGVRSQCWPQCFFWSERTLSIEENTFYYDDTFNTWTLNMIHSIHSASFKRILVSGAFPSATDFFSFPDFRLFLFVYGSYVIHKHHPPQHPRVLLWLDKVLGRVHKHHPSQDHCDVLFLEKLGKCVVCVCLCVCVLGRARRR